MSTNCKNCDNIFEGNFCNNCGQTAHTHAINMHYLWHDIQHGIFHVDSGIFYTIKELFLRPGITIRNFIEGKRVAYFKPVAMIFLLATLYGLLYHYSHITIPSVAGEHNDEAARITAQIHEWVGSHYALSTLILMPFYTLGSYLAFKKSGYNYVEHGILNLYLGSIKIVLNFAIFPLFYIYNNTKEMLMVMFISLILDIFLGIYGYYSFFNGFRPGNRIIRIILSIIYTYIFIFGIPTIIGLVAASFMINK